MTYSTKVQRVNNPDGVLFMVKVRLSPDYEETEGAHVRTVHALTEEGAAIEAMQAAFEQPDEPDEQAPEACDSPDPEAEPPAETENPADKPADKPAPKAAAKKATKKK